MQEKLKALSELQTVDVEIAARKKSVEVYPKQMGELEKQLADARAAVEAERTRLTEIERQRRTLEQNIVEEKDKVKKWEARLSEQRSTREYAALAREIDIAKKANQTMAEELIELTKSQNGARDAVKAKEQELAAKQTDIGTKMVAIRKKIDESKVEIGALDAKRQKAAGTVDAKLLQRYEAVRKKRMPALASVKSGICQGCNMNVPPQLYNTLCATLSTDLCPSCHRIIYAAEALEAPAHT